MTETTNVDVLFKRIKELEQENKRLKWQLMIAQDKNRGLMK